MDFYDDLAPLYHLMFPDWSNSIRRQGEQLDSIIQSEWPGHRTVLDVSCGIGTQTLALAGRGYSVVGSDLSAKEIERARREADLRSLAIDFRVGDMRTAHEDHGTGYDLVISCDNSVPHLLTDKDLLLALRQFLACLRPGGGCVITVRDYDEEERGTNLVKHYGARVEDGKRYGRSGRATLRFSTSRAPRDAFRCTSLSNASDDDAFCSSERTWSMWDGLHPPAPSRPPRDPASG